MVNQLRAGDDDLVFVDYNDLLTQILAVLQDQPNPNPFSISRENNHLLIDIDTIATLVANQQVNNPLGATAFSPRAATANFSPGFREQFPNQIEAIKTCLITLLESVLTRTSQKFSIEQFISSLIRDLQTFQGNASFDFTYPFSKNYELQKQRLTLEDSSNSNKDLLKFHKLAISVQNISNFNTHLKQGLANYINIQFAGASESEAEFRDILDIYVRCLYPVGSNLLPIGDKYQEFPFVVFKSYSLGEIRSKFFADNYLLNSPELNVLNLILSQKSPPGV